MNKIFSRIITIAFIFVTTSCSYKPIFSEKNYNFQIDELILSGDKDSLIDHSILSNLVKKLNSQNNIMVKHEIIKGSNHFFTNHENSVQQKINNYIKS